MIVSSNSQVWLDTLQQPLSQRIGPAPSELTAYIASVNSTTDHPLDPQSFVVPEDFLQDVRAAIDEMPEAVKQRLQDSLLGVYFAKGVGSSAATDVVAKNTGEVIGIVTVLDLDAFLERSANQWATWKENSPFSPMGSYTIEAIIEDPENDNRKNAMQYLLLHEFGHVLTADNVFLPNWWVSPDRFKSTDEYTFLQLSWQIAMSNEIIPLLREDFDFRKSIVYYTGARLSSDDIPNAYEALEKTSFVTLYAAMSAYEDFAESFASYVHTVLMKKPFGIRIRREGKIIKTVENYWSNDRSSEKYQILKEFLGDG